MSKRSFLGIFNGFQLRVLFEDVITVATKKGLYLQLQFQNLTNTCWGKVPKFQEKVSYHSRVIYQKTPRRVKPPRPYMVKICFTAHNVAVQLDEP